MIAVIAITVTGFSATIAQIILLRELMVRCQGNELSAGIILFCWLTWNAVGCRLGEKYSSGKPVGKAALGLMLAVAAVLMPIALLLIRGAGFFWVLTPGEAPSPGSMLQICMISTGLFSPMAGALYSLCWAFYRQIRTAGPPLPVFIGEGIGAAGGGAAFYLFFIGRFPTLTAVWLISAGMILFSAVLVRPWRLYPTGKALRMLWIFFALFLLFAFGHTDLIETESRLKQWGAHIVVVRDTPYHNLAILQEDDQLSVLADGLWLFSIPDAPGLEQAVHPALLQHPAPRNVLLLGGGAAGLVTEILKHHGVQRIDYVEQDAALIDVMQPYWPSDIVRSLTAPQVTLLFQDPGLFIHGNGPAYDVILMNMGDPVNAGLNRFYTQAFFTRIQQRLSRGGVFSFAVTGGGDMLGDAQRSYLTAIYHTLSKVFADTVLYPGDHFRFFASNLSHRLTISPETLSARIRERKLELFYVREDTLQDTFSPFRLNYFQSILTRKPAPRTNTDFRPTCYIEGLNQWIAQWHTGLQSAFSWVTGLAPGRLWGLMTIMGAILLLVSFRFRVPPGAAVSGSMFIVGGAVMVLQLVLLLSFQILAGFLYLQLAFIISAFMAGLAAGAMFIAKKVGQPAPERTLLRIMGLLCIYPLFLIAVLHLLHGPLRPFVPPALSAWGFTALSLAAGMLGGAFYAQAIACLPQAKSASGNAGVRLYALDLAGAAVGLILATFLLLPAYGIIHTLCFTSAAILMGFPSFFFIHRHRSKA